MTINIIHLPHGEGLPPHRKLRFDNLCAEIKKNKIQDVLLWKGILGATPKNGISLAHKQIVKDAKEKNLPMVCIGEDDLCFYGRGGAWEYFLKNIPEDFDIYTGCYFSGEHDENFTVKGHRGMLLYIVHHRFYHQFLSLPESIHIDGALAASSAIIKVCPKFVTYQLDGYSDQRKRIVHDNIRHKGKPIFCE